MISPWKWKELNHGGCFLTWNSAHERRLLDGRELSLFRTITTFWTLSLLASCLTRICKRWQVSFARPAAIYYRICREKQYSLPICCPNPGLWDYSCSKRIKALAGREKLTRLHGSYRQNWGDGLIPINTFLMSLCCSPLLELTADGRTWLHLACIERSLDVRCREMEQAWAASREQSEAVRNDCARGREVPLRAWPFEYKAFVRNPEKNEPNQSGWLCLSFKGSSCI